MLEQRVSKFDAKTIMNSSIKSWSRSGLCQTMMMMMMMMMMMTTTTTTTMMMTMMMIY